MRTLPWILVWAATLCGAWWLGRESAPVSPSELSGAPGAGRGNDRASLDARKYADRFGEPEVRTVPVDEPPGLHGTGHGEEFRARLFEYVSAQLAAGRDRHLALYTALDRAFADGVILRLLADEQVGPRTIYPLLRFLIARAEQFAAFAETVFRKAAEQPEWFEGTSTLTFAWFAEDLGPILAGMLGETRLQRLREHVQTILDQPQERQPAALRDRRGALQRLLGRWAPVVSSEEALARLKSGKASGSEALALLLRTRFEDRKGLDLVAILGPLLDEGNVAGLTADALASRTAAEQAALDTRLIDASARLGTLSDWHLRRWLEVTGRTAFDHAAEFLEQALRQGGRTADAAALALLGLSTRPSPEEADKLLRSYNVSARVAASVRQAFGIK